MVFVIDARGFCNRWALYQIKLQVVTTTVNLIKEVNIINHRFKEAAFFCFWGLERFGKL